MHSYYNPVFAATTMPIMVMCSTDAGDIGLGRMEISDAVDPGTFRPRAAVNKYFSGRCRYCGVKHYDDERYCCACGAPL